MRTKVASLSKLVFLSAVLVSVSAIIPTRANAGENLSSAVIEACLAKGPINISVCKSAQAISDRVERATKNFLHENGLDHGTSAVVAGAVKTIAERRFNVTTHMNGVDGSIDFEPQQLSLTLLWRF